MEKIGQGLYSKQKSLQSDFVSEAIDLFRTGIQLSAEKAYDELGKFMDETVENKTFLRIISFILRKDEKRSKMGLRFGVQMLLSTSSIALLKNNEEEQGIKLGYCFVNMIPYLEDLSYDEIETSLIDLFTKAEKETEEVSELIKETFLKEYNENFFTSNHIRILELLKK